MNIAPASGRRNKVLLILPPSSECLGKSYIKRFNHLI